MTEKLDFEITKTWISGKKSCAIVIPKRFALELGFESSTPVYVEKRQNTIVIKKLEVQ